ncbi:aminotransferase class V-fold PLP-dependent enzyme, partial [Frankia sp. ACN1ag]
GALVVRRGLVLEPLTHGGGQERDIRSGTLNTAGVAAFAAAAATACAQAPREGARLAALRDDLVRRVQEKVPGAVLNGAPLGGPQRLPGNAHLTFPGCEGDSLLMLLDARGIECSTGSACSAGVARPSHVLLAMGAGEEHARGSLRFSLGHSSRAADVDALVEAIGPVVERASRAGALAGMTGA